MISIEDAMRKADDEIAKVCRILLDRYRIGLLGERDPDVEAKVLQYEKELVAYRIKAVAEWQRELEVFCNEHRVLH